MKLPDSGDNGTRALRESQHDSLCATKYRIPELCPECDFISDVRDQERRIIRINLIAALNKYGTPYARELLILQEVFGPKEPSCEQ